MTLDIIKPNFPPQTIGYYPYLASVGIDYSTLQNCCVKKATVTGIDSLTTVSLDIDGVAYTDVPVYIHTDCGARDAVVEAAIAEAAEEEPVEKPVAEYFKNAALMFPFPGDIETGEGTTIDPTVLVFEHTDPGTLVVSILGVFHILQSVLQTFPDSLDPFRTYTPHVKLMISERGASDDTYHAVYNLLDGSFSITPEYSEADYIAFENFSTWGTPLSISQTYPVFLPDSAYADTRIDMFFRESIELSSSDCFNNLGEARYGDTNQRFLYYKQGWYGIHSAGAVVTDENCFTVLPDRQVIGSSYCMSEEEVRTPVVLETTGIFPYGTGSVDVYYPCSESTCFMTSVETVSSPYFTRTINSNLNAKSICNSSLGYINHRPRTFKRTYDDRDIPENSFTVRHVNKGTSDVEEVTSYTAAGYGYTFISTHAVTEGFDVLVNGQSLLGAPSFSSSFDNSSDQSVVHVADYTRYDGSYASGDSDFNKAFLYDIHSFYGVANLQRSTVTLKTAPVSRLEAEYIIDYDDPTFKVGKLNLPRAGSLAQYSVADAFKEMTDYMVAEGMLVGKDVWLDIAVEASVYFVPYDIEAGALP